MNCCLSLTTITVHEEGPRAGILIRILKTCIVDQVRLRIAGGALHYYGASRNFYAQGITAKRETWNHKRLPIVLEGIFLGAYFFA